MAFTFLELLVVLATLALLMAVLMSARAMTGADVVRITCANNLKRIGVATRVWADQKWGRFPIRVPATQGGPPNQAQLAAPNADAGYTYQCFGVLSNELQSPKVLVCPADFRSAHSNFVMMLNYKSSGPFLNNTVVSYFVGRDTTPEWPRMLLAGDRNIGPTETAPGFGYSPDAFVFFGRAVALGTNINEAPLQTVGWTMMMHQKAGNVVFADGHVELLTSMQLREALQKSGDWWTSPGPNYILFP